MQLSLSTPQYSSVNSECDIMCNCPLLIVWNELLSLLKPGTLIVGVI